jgi:hypothetical protein
MVAQARRLAIATALIWIGIGASFRVEAGGIVLSTPAGLTPGDSFRFAFVTEGTTTATSSNIADYNSFVNMQAGGATYNGSVVNWDAIGSTATVNAIDNVGQQPIVGVFLADGTLVTTSTTTTGLWSGTLSNAIIEDLSSVANFAFVWTGTTSAGVAATVGVASSGPLGDIQHPTQGASYLSASDWVDIGDGNAPPVGSFGMYAISDVLVVPTAVPEPSTLLMASISLLAGLAFSWSRSGGAHRRQRPVGRPAAPE